MEVFSLFIVMLFAFSAAWAQAGQQGLPSLRPQSSLSVEKKSDFLVSKNGSFSSGFYKVGTNAYCYSIWFTNSLNKTVVWMANRDRPVNGKKSMLTLHKKGNLILTDADGSIIWSTNTFSEAYVEARLLETGNLVLINQAEEVIWESFDFPTDTLLPTQPLVKNTTVVSMRSQGTYLSGFFNLKFDDNNVLNLIYNGPLVSSIYWPNPSYTVFFSHRTPYNSSRVAFLNEKGRFRSSDNLKLNASDYGTGPKRRLTLDYDGILRMYSLNESTGLWDVTWLPGDLDSCMVHGLCGENGVCSYKPLPACTCPYGFKRNDLSDWSKGCSPQFNLTCNATELDFIKLSNTDYFGYDLNTYGTNMAFEACKNACLSDCKCRGFGYTLDGQGECFPKRTLLNGYHKPSTLMTMHIKVLRGMVISHANQGQVKTNDMNCSDAEIVLSGYPTSEEESNKNWYMKYLILFVASFAVTEIICFGLGWWYVFRKQAHVELVDTGYILLALGFKRYTFSELKKATGNFKKEIGKGGFGAVYKGILDNERVVAVKRLEGILQGETQFWAEVSIIGSLNHRNLVKIWGFCAEGEHKLLVYDYMEIGSLDKILFFPDSSRTLGWEQRCNIALGTAKGLSYIHEECLEWVLHCDVKPQNILLDDDLEPKLTDFGMSKLFRDNRDTGFSRVRGTRGYLAPEWMMNQEINAKADVYSYGIVLLELLTGKSAFGFLFDAAQDNEYNHIVGCVRQKIKNGRLMEVIDPRLDLELNDEKLERMVKIALLCVEEDRDTRPAMSKVVELLTGYYDESSPVEAMKIDD